MDILENDRYCYKNDNQTKQQQKKLPLYWFFFLLLFFFIIGMILLYPWIYIWPR